MIESMLKALRRPSRSPAGWRSASSRWWGRTTKGQGKARACVSKGVEAIMESWVSVMQREKYLGISVAELPGKFFSSGKFSWKQPKLAAEGCQFQKKYLKNENFLAKSPHNLENENGVANFADDLKNPKIIWLSRWSGKYLDTLRTFQIVWKVSKHSGKFPDNLKSFQALWKVSIYSGKFWDTAENSKIFWKI